MGRYVTVPSHLNALNSPSILLITPLTHSHTHLSCTRVLNCVPLYLCTSIPLPFRHARPSCTARPSMQRQGGAPAVWAAGSTLPETVMAWAAGAGEVKGGLLAGVRCFYGRSMAGFASRRGRERWVWGGRGRQGGRCRASP